MEATTAMSDSATTAAATDPRSPRSKSPMRRSTKLEAFDVVLFCGNEPVSQFISKVESVFVVPALQPSQRFVNTWTHAGILIDKNVLPLDCLEDGRLYLYESILCGRILNVYEYSKVLPVDHKIDPKYGFHIGPQIREWLPVVEEVGADVAVCKMDAIERERLLSPEHIEETRSKALEFYNAHKDWGYPINPLPQFAAANQDLYQALTLLRTSMQGILEKVSQVVPDAVSAKLQLSQSKEIFCSEMVAKLYGDLEVTGFCERKPPKNRFIHHSEFTPLDLEVMDVLKDGIVHVKLCGKVLLDTSRDAFGSIVTAIDHDLQKRAFPHLQVPTESWAPVHNGLLPPLATPSGYTSDGQPCYIARALIGKSLHIGYTTLDGEMHCGWEGRELRLTYDHEVLLLPADNHARFEWVTVGRLMPGFVPSRAVVGGCDAVGAPYYIARTRIAELGGVGLGALVIGRVSPSLGGARFVYKGKEVTKGGEYEVLSEKVHFLERFLLWVGTDHYLMVIVAIVVYILGVFRVHDVLLGWLFPGLFSKV
ncbi:hypothetical protein BC830DRAFT_1154939 [Chytriomyces sp. MP71]|nr:hypothetical protein BC830DRAFT_1154939 [Chytriomyces sp. MP71]